MSQHDKLCQFVTLGKTCRKHATGSCPFAHTPEEQKKALENMTEKKKALEKTQMCGNILSTGRCPFGKRCSFAHTRAELKLPVCLNGDKCRRKQCTFVHPNETPAQYRARTGLPHPHDEEVVATVPNEFKDRVIAARQRDQQEQEEMINLLREDAVLGQASFGNAVGQSSLADMMGSMKLDDSAMDLHEEVNDGGDNDEGDDGEEDDDEEDDDEEEGDLEIVVHRNFPGANAVRVDSTGKAVGVFDTNPLREDPENDYLKKRKIVDSDSDHEEESDEEESDEEESDKKPKEVVKVHPDFEKAFASVSPKEKLITAQLTPEQFLALFPKLMELGVKFST